MGVRFAVLDPGTAYTAARSVLEYTNDTTHVTRLLRAHITQESLTTDDRVRARILRKTAAGTGTARTPLALDGTGSTFGGTARSNMTAEGTPGDVLWQEGFSILTGFYWTATDPDEIIVPPGGILAMDIDAPAASTTFNALMEFEVLGALT